VGYFSPSKTERDKKSAKLDPLDGPPKHKTATLSPTPALSETVSTLGRGMLVTGNITCAGSIEIYGHVVGDVHASHLAIFEDARVEGKVVAQDAVVNGTFKGVIHGNTVELQGKAVVEGEIFNRSLAIAKDAQFEGVARRLEKPVEGPSSSQLEDERAAFAVMAEVVPLAGAGR
jgi:cytoskeletal protein CcmA (bactofilin family)